MEDNAASGWAESRAFPGILASMLFLFLPFTQALTFSVGFPLKFSELALILLVPIYFIYKKKVIIPRVVFLLLSSFVFVTVVFTIINIFWSYDYPLRTYDARFGYIGDSILRLIYFLLAVFAFFIASDLISTGGQRFLNLWVWGALFAGGYSIYLCLFSALGHDVILLPGMELPPQMIYGKIIRCGTFPEGNSMGLFLVVSASVAFHIGSKRSGFFLLVCVFSTFSTLSIICSLGFITFLLLRFIMKKSLRVKITLSLCFIAALFFFLSTPLAKSFILEKLSVSNGGDEAITEASYSRIDRLKSIDVAFQMGVDNIFTGVGLSNYSRHYDRYLDKGNVQMSDEMMKSLKRTGLKVIPNNIYLEIFSELGLIGLLIFVSFWFVLLSYSIKRKFQYITIGLLAVLFCGNAYPSFVLIYLWIFGAIPVSGFYYERNEQTSYSHR